MSNGCHSYWIEVIKNGQQQLHPTKTDLSPEYMNTQRQADFRSGMESSRCNGVALFVDLRFDNLAHDYLQ